MEFVLVTTRSTPESSEGGSSIMKFGDYREDDEEKSVSGVSIADYYYKDVSSDSDEDLPLLEGFEESSARQRLLKSNYCSKVILNDEKQQELDLVVGINVSEEYPWKQVTRQSLLDCFTDDDPSPNVTRFRQKLSALEDTELVLAGYVPSLSLEGDDTFLFFENEDAAKEASKIIQQFEAFERRKIKKIFNKRPRPWKSAGSEKEVELQIEKQRTNVAEVEIQLMYPVGQAYKPFEHRFVNDARDGYVELIPKPDEISTLRRTKIDVGIQTAPRRIELEQQTDPTFPANAWTQYFYEIKQEEINEKEIQEEVTQESEEKVESGDEMDADKGTDESKDDESIIPSEAIQKLFEALEFNAIDMYRDDYSLLAKKQFPSYVAPYLKEVFCFTDLNKATKQYVSAIEWHPSLSGIFVCSYAKQTSNTVTFIDEEKFQNKNEKLLSPSYQVLVWSFDDLLYPKFELETPREITCLSFCPYDENLLIGGTSNGQLVMWDLTDCLQIVETEEKLSEAQINYRKRIFSFMLWTKLRVQRKIFAPVVATEITQSHKKEVSCIRWVSRNYYIAPTGLIHTSSKPGELYRNFISTSLDGTISFWDLDYIDPNETKVMVIKRKYTLPEDMKQKVSAYARLNGILRPTYTVSFEHPITNLAFDEGRFRFEPIENLKRSPITKRAKFTVNEEPLENMSNKLIVSTLLGAVATFNWEGFLCKEGKPEYVKQAEYNPTIHDGPIHNIERNPFVPELLLTIGQNIVAVWSEFFQGGPIFWRKRDHHITDGKWSLIRASVFFITRIDGNIELWDILTRTDAPSIAHNLGGHIITVISQHKLPLATDVLVVGDHKGNVRVFTPPAEFLRAVTEEVTRLKKYTEREIKRKQQFIAWQSKYGESNIDTRENTILIRDESKKKLERLENDGREKEDKRKSTDEHLKHNVHVKSKSVYDLPERLHKKWDAWNIKRLMNNLLSLKQFDPELLAIRLKPEKDRLAYNEQKRRAVSQQIREANENIANIRSRLMPTATVNQTQERLDLITKNAKKMLSATEYDSKYENVEKEMIDEVNQRQYEKLNLNWMDILQDARNRRISLNRFLVKQKIDAL